MSFKYIQARKTQLNLILMNLIVSDLAIIFVGVPLDILGSFTKWKSNKNIVCPAVAFTHTIFGNMKNKVHISTNDSYRLFKYNSNF